MKADIFVKRSVLNVFVCLVFWGCNEPSERGQVIESSPVSSGVELNPILTGPVSLKPIVRKKEFVGSSSCIECHERFYKLWSTSHHGLAMQDFTPEFAKKELIQAEKKVTVGKSDFRVKMDGDTNVMVETVDGKQVNVYPMVHAMGGKNVYFFLTPLEKGKLQVMPLGYDVRRKEWYNATQSMVRMALSDDMSIEWTDPMLTFNTSCYNCHISQLQTNYDDKDGSYHTTWKEPGINCETCHDGASEHIRVCREAALEGRRPTDLKLIITKKYRVDQHNSACSTCHAKAGRIWKRYNPGEPFYDYYEPAVFNDQDFYPDGRDLGENYTHASWSMSACAKSGQLSCIHCHTSSGRYRYKDQDKKFACMPCHEQEVENPEQHTHHKKDSEGSLCISCHMPTTEFSRMLRSDHSMRAPMPAATMEFDSPNACNICHDEKDAKWADEKVRSWTTIDYQAQTLKLGHWIKAVRLGDWSDATNIFAYMISDDSDEMFTASFLRMIGSCNDSEKWVVLEKCMNNPSPLVRSAAVSELRGSSRRESLDMQIVALKDEVRLVRMRAAYALADLPRAMLSPDNRELLEKVSGELEESYQVQRDSWSSHYSLGNYYSARGWLDKAVKSYETAMSLRDDVIAPLVNAATAYAKLARNDDAEKVLRKALDIEPHSDGVLFNLGLLLAEKGDVVGAIKYLTIAVEVNPQQVQAAYNLGILLIQSKDESGLDFLKMAVDNDPESSRYGYSYAFYLAQLGKTTEAMDCCVEMIRTNPGNLQVIYFYAQLLDRAGRKDDAVLLLQKTLELNTIHQRDRTQLMNYIQQLKLK